MSAKHLFSLLLIFVLSSGCKLMERQQSPNIAQTPPYLQSQSERSQNQLADMRAFHERESAVMSEDLRAAHDRETAQLKDTGRELQRDNPWQEGSAKTPENKEKWMSWTNWFKKADKRNV